MEKLLEVKNIYASTNKKPILKGLSLTINKGETHIILGPNGAGKTTLGNVILNNPAYTLDKGKITFDGHDLKNLTTDEIAKLGVFMSFQLPAEIAGISTFNFIKTAKSKQQKNVNVFELKEELNNLAKQLQIKQEMLSRDLNLGFSGGEKKKNEILQLLALNPKLAILDETDSGLDVDAIKVVSKGINLYKNNNNAVLIITHNAKILENLEVDKVHILIDGKIVHSGDAKLVKEIEKNGFSAYKEGK